MQQVTTMVLDALFAEAARKVDPETHVMDGIREVVLELLGWEQRVTAGEMSDRIAMARKTAVYADEELAKRLRREVVASMGFCFCTSCRVELPRYAPICSACYEKSEKAAV